MRLPHRQKTTSGYGASRHAAVSRRAVLKCGLTAGAGLVIVGCGSDSSGLEDASIQQDPSTTAPDGSDSTSSAAPSAAPDSTAGLETDPSATAPPDTAAPTTAAPAAADGAALPAGSEMIVSFTYQQASGGKNEPPYIAVWIEDTNGALVQTVSLWYLQQQKGRKWLPDLVRWFGVDQTRINAGGADSVDVVSGPTRLPGQYSVAWDGTAADGTVPTAGDYFVCIESAREHGPNSLIRQPIELTGQPLAATLPDATELVMATVSIA